MFCILHSQKVEEDLRIDYVPFKLIACMDIQK